MRFHADGPDIPDKLLESRDKGNVVFFCGSGVSMPAGMPGFLGLAKCVFDKLHVPQYAQLRSLLKFAGDESTPEAARPALDRIFNQLQHEYPPGEVDYYVTKRLETKPNPCVSIHRTVLRLSKGADGSPQVVTTNFDLLFEHADNEIDSFIPPYLPDLASGQKLKGLVYLHGRIDPERTNRESRQGFVLSSSDFGRAYLAEGWATLFVRELLDRYTVVLLGYSANDPPVEYLLQGLQSSEQQRREPIYAFVNETDGFDQSVWNSRGVTALTYSSLDKNHAELWNSLEAWADRADDPSAWQQSIIELARNGPRDLRRHERGQVVSLVRTSEGAQVFADSDPPPPSEWLCVFDSNIRQGEVVRDPYGEKPDHDPQELYGIDDDSLLPANLLTISPQDPRADSLLRLAGMPDPEQIPLPPRLFRLALWIVNVSHEPIAMWWIAKQRSLHPFLVPRIKTQLRQNSQEFHLLARTIWNLLFEMHHNFPSEHDFSLYNISDRVRIEGWTRGALREFEENSQPRIGTKSRLSNNPDRPPQQEWANLQLSDIATFTIVFPRIREFSPDTPNEILPRVYRIGRRQLEHAVDLLADLDKYTQEEVRFYLQNGSELMMDDDPNVFPQWFCDLLDRMAESYPKLLRADVELWPINESFFFDKLRLRIWSFESVFSGNEVAEGILSLSDGSFWNVFYRQDLLHLLRDRWQEISYKNRIQIEQRIVKGKPTRE